MLIIDEYGSQRSVTTTVTPFSLAQELLPAELLHDVKLPIPKASLESQD